MANENQSIEPVVIVGDKPYKLRSLQAKDLFLLTRVISALGIKKLAEVFNEKVDVAAVTESAEAEDAVRDIGYGTVIEIVGIVIDNLPNCQNDLFKFLAAISNLNEKQVSTLPLGDFVNMITDVVQMQEFRDFFTQAEKFLR